MLKYASIVILVLSFNYQIVYARTNPYKTGYKHGVQDGKTETIREDFVNHTAKYDQGWVDGWSNGRERFGQWDV